MKRMDLMLFGVVILVGASPAILSSKTFRGEIMDTQCAKMGSHDVMMKKGGARNTVECVRDCFKMGGKFVLYDANTKTAYQLSDQKMPEQFAGQKVEITGTYDESANTIRVAGIERVVSPSLRNMRK